MEAEHAVMPEVAGSRGALTERRDRRSVRAWLEDAWRHGEVVDDEDGLETAPPSPRHDRFSTPSGDLVQ